MQEIQKGTAPRIPQGKDYTIAPMLEKNMTKISFETTAYEIKNKVYGLNPIMGAYANYHEKKIKFWKVKVLDENETKTLEAELKKEASLGEVVKADDKLGLYIKTKEGIISVLEIQGENGKRMGICDFLRGNKIEVGERFD